MTVPECACCGMTRPDDDALHCDCCLEIMVRLTLLPRRGKAYLRDWLIERLVMKPKQEMCDGSVPK